MKNALTLMQNESSRRLKKWHVSEHKLWNKVNSPWPNFRDLFFSDYLLPKDGLIYCNGVFLQISKTGNPWYKMSKHVLKLSYLCLLDFRDVVQTSTKVCPRSFWSFDQWCERKLSELTVSGEIWIQDVRIQWDRWCCSRSSHNQQSFPKDCDNFKRCARNF